MPACHETLFSLSATRLRPLCSDNDFVDAVSSRHSEGKPEKSFSFPGVPLPSVDGGRPVFKKGAARTNPTDPSSLRSA